MKHHPSFAVAELAADLFGARTVLALCLFALLCGSGRSAEPKPAEIRNAQRAPTGQDDRAVGQSADKSTQSVDSVRPEATVSETKPEDDSGPAEMLRSALERLEKKKRRRASANGSDAEVPMETMENAAREILAGMLPVPGTSLMMGRTEVTQKQWEGIAGSNPSRFTGADRPVESVTWSEVDSFIRKLNSVPAVTASGLVFRLPHQDEWERACRAGSRGAYGRLASGEEGRLSEMGWYADNTEDGRMTRPVGRLKPNAWGFYDMHGNVAEWTSDSAKGGNSFMVVCGGDWGSWGNHCRSDYTEDVARGKRNSAVGFRLCAERTTRPSDAPVAGAKSIAPDSADPAAK